MKSLVEESGMSFFVDMEYSFLPEKVEPYTTLVKGNGIKTCDLICFKKNANNNRLEFIEAKSTAPNPSNPASTKAVKDYAYEILDKFTHSILLIIGISVHREYPSQFDKPLWMGDQNLPKSKFLPILIVKSHKKEWLQELTDVLRKELKGIKKAFMLEDLIILNEEIARKKGYIQ